MIEWPDSPKKETWGAFVKYAREFGVTIEEIPSFEYPDGRVGPLVFMRREIGGEVLNLPLPMGCTPDRILRLIRMEQASSRLRLKTPKWPITL